MIGTNVSMRTRWIALLAVLAACGGGAGGGYSAPAQSSTPPPASSATLAVATDARLGNHLVDGNGRSLYYYAKDVPAGGSQAAVSNCNDAGCLSIWPIFGADNVAAQGIDATSVAQITRSDGRKQATYKGFPLYYYAGDGAAGDVKGEDFGDLWFVAHDPTYSVAQLSKAGESATYLTDGDGRALYVFASDTVGTSTAPPVSACTSQVCVTNWPTFVVDQLVVPSDLS